ncbi:MAG: exopolysaccharide biosynthesis polyprenyl glycosylphosphotransferase [Verrucomicrobiales bacterium]|nr:exopolysaccharide biosynthesis polyprenyl glycosylphosphotransferase [Verrucomicrobiales bacterium]
MLKTHAISRRVLRTLGGALFDALAVVFVYVLAMMVRFGEPWNGMVTRYWPAVLVGAIAAPSVFYVGGMYGGIGQKTQGDWVWRLRLILSSLVVTTAVILTIGSLDFSSRVGRGVLGLATLLLAIVWLSRHLYWSARKREKTPTSAVCLVSSSKDEQAATLMARQMAGVIVRGVLGVNGYQPCGDLKSLGDVGSFDDREETGTPDLILVRENHLVDPNLTALLRRWRFAGVEIAALADVYENAFQAVPLGLVSESWLFRATSQTGIGYVRKVKRLYDLAVATILLLVLGPLALLALGLVKIFSPGPALFRQVRLGRLGREFEVLKIRTMHLNAEEEGPMWSAGKNDARCYPLGNWLRKFRIDEIPQLINILKGEMSFVGPRPERPEFFDMLEAEIPHYRERLLMQPGLTGWAQVSYPYGSSVDDAWRKHEYDLYYFKHMSLLLDCVVLVRTVRTILSGGVREPELVSEAMSDWRRMARENMQERRSRVEAVSSTTGGQVERISKAV